MPDQDLKQPTTPIQGEDLEQYLLRGRQEIRRLLQDLIATRALISIHLQPGGLSFLSTLITLSEDENWLFLDASTSETIRRRALEAESMLCVTQLNKVRIQFHLINGSELQIEGRPALAMEVPDEIMRLQRRDAFRLQVPLSHNLVCVLPSQRPHYTDGKTVAKSIRSLTTDAAVVDISASGVSIEIPFNKSTPTVGDKYENCQLRLPHDHMLEVTLEVRNYGRRIQGNGKEVLRLGCGFVSPAPQAAKLIQHYIFQTQREIKARTPDPEEKRKRDEPTGKP
jgi:c-di-GMP-binding flagellar brake protein YcgR